MQLKNFRWRGVNQSGNHVSGQEMALAEQEVRDKLKKQQIRIKKIRRGRISMLARLLHRVKARDITILTRQLATMLATGVPLIQALKLVSDNNRKAEMKSILSQTCKGVEAGNPISNTLRSASVHFDSLYVDLVATGEQSGSLPEVFDRLATYREKSEQLRAKVAKALIYPIMVVLVALSVSYLMFVVVIPEFESMFKGFGAELPWFTQQVIYLSHWVQTYSLFILFIVATATIGVKVLRKRSFQVRLLTSQLGLKAPIIGDVLSKAALAKFSRTLATSFSAGIPILSCLKIAAKTLGNLYYQTTIESVYQDASAGMPLYIAMRNSCAFPEMVLQMVMIGEESGSLDEMLNKVASIYEFEIDNTVDNLGKLLEPLIIVFLGVVIGGLVVAMYLPIFNLMSVLG
jgi:type IV pilus assembly protein PilC